MALPTLNDVKRYLRKQTTNEDTLITALLASAIGRVETYLRRPIEAVSQTFVDEAEGAPCSLILPVTPVSALTSVTDADGTTLTIADLRFSIETGLVKYKDGSAFVNGPYTIVATVGLSARVGYASRIEPVISQAIFDTVADLYQHRNPNATNEMAGGGVAVTYSTGNAEGVPHRVAAMLAPFRMVGVA